jgi:hypothetical protein
MNCGRSGGGVTSFKQNNMKEDLQKVKTMAKDLRNEEPRPAHEELAGYSIAARCLDKCRATLVGVQGDFTYGCPMDQMFLKEAGITDDEFKKFVATGATDEEVEDWLRQK